MTALAFIVILGVFGLYYLIQRVRRKQRRANLMVHPLPTAWREIIHRNVPLVSLLPKEYLPQLEGLIQIFLEEKNFEGCGGLELNDEIKVTIAAQACVLLLGRKTDIYPKLISILVYPSTYVAKQSELVTTGSLVEGASVRLGESWHQGVLVLAWDSVVQGARDLHDGHNVVLHEFAHQLDQEDGNSDGAPILDSSSAYRAWARLFSQEYQDLHRALEKHQHTIIDPYGATNPAEFFAVVTETFFEKPKLLQKKNAELYEVLKNFYRLDPLAWFRPKPSE